MVSSHDLGLDMRQSRYWRVILATLDVAVALDRNGALAEAVAGTAPSNATAPMTVRMRRISR
jgi:hypothetical protein